jgi:tetratricopeptide (TPR) repeat protein
VKPLHHRRLALTATMLALCATSGMTGEAQPAPATTGDAAAAKALDAFANERDAHQAGTDKAGEYHFVLGMRAKEENRLPDAVRELTLAVDYAPANADYAAQLRAVRGLAGLERDTRSQQIDQMVDEVQVKDQELWNEAQAKKEEGIAAMQAGEFGRADRSFQMALVRIESLPFTSDRKTSATRELETLLGDARERREARDRDDAAARNRAASDRSRELRDLGLQLERDRIDAMLRRALRARERRDYDESILICEQVLKLNRADERAGELLAKCRRERHVYIRQMTADRWDEEHKLLSESIRSAMLPQLELVRYTTEWPELDARRSAPVQGLEEKSESWRKEITNQLEQEITLDFQDTDLADVVSFLQRVTNANMVLDPRVLAAAPPPVTLRVERMKLKFVLDFIMRITALKYTLRNEAIYISNEEGTRGDLFMKLYDVRDLTHAMASFPGPSLEIPDPGGEGSTLLPPIDDAEPPQTDEFIEIIKSVVAPASWSDESGTTIQEYNGSMVVTQSGEVHDQIDVLLRNLRNQRGSQIHVKCKFLTVENAALEEIGVNWQNTANAPAIYSPTAGVAWGDAQNQILTAGTVNTSLRDYGQNRLGRSGSDVDGLHLNAATWQVGSELWANAVLTAVEKERRGNVIFEPDITLFNGQQAHIVSMNQQSYIADYDVVQGQYDPIISILSYGTVLDVQAIASADKKYITLTLRPTN